jgi:hypothetical protein
MEFVPQMLVVGAIVFPPELAQEGRLPAGSLDRVWMELRNSGLKYGSFQLTPDESGATISGARPRDIVNLSPPLVQIQVPLDDGTSVDSGAKRARTVMEIAGRVFRVPKILNLAVRVFYQVPLPTNDARDLLLHRVLSRGGENVDQLRLDQEIWAGTKFVIPHGSGQYTLNIEPLVADQMKSLFLDVEGSFPAPDGAEAVEARVDELGRYVNGNVNAYLNSITKIEGT